MQLFEPGSDTAPVPQGLHREDATVLEYVFAGHLKQSETDYPINAFL